MVINGFDLFTAYDHWKLLRTFQSFNISKKTVAIEVNPYGPGHQSNMKVINCRRRRAYMNVQQIKFSAEFKQARVVF